MENPDLEKIKRNARGRGTGSLVKPRFESLQLSYAEEEERQFKTQLLEDQSRSIISHNDSPDVGFNSTINIYRGCEHGCIYCYARPTHEYLGLSSGLDFESKIFVKMNAPELLRKALSLVSYKPQTLGMSGVTDCYQPFEKKLKLTRQCLEVLAEFRNPLVIITKNHLVTRDIDILSELSLFNAVHVILSITTLDENLARKMEPRASTPKRRLEALAALSHAKISTGVNVAPVIPGLTDHEIPNILKAAKEQGAQAAHYTMLRLPYAVKDLFVEWLSENFPTKKNKVLNHIQDMRHGKLNSTQFGERMKGNGSYAEHIEKMFTTYRNIFKFNQRNLLSSEHFRNSKEKQLVLF